MLMDSDVVVSRQAQITDPQSFFFRTARARRPRQDSGNASLLGQGARQSLIDAWP